MSKDISKMIENSIDNFYPKFSPNFKDILLLFTDKQTLIKNTTIFIDGEFNTYFTDLNNTKWHYKVNIDQKQNLVQIALRDCPFIIDSILILISKLNYSIDSIIHFPIFVERDKDGKILKTYDVNFENKNTEAVIFFKLSSAFAGTEIQKNIENLILAIFSVASNWNAMKEVILQISKNINSPLNNQIHKTNQQIESFLLWLIDGGFVFCGVNCLEFKNDRFVLNKVKSIGLIQNKPIYNEFSDDYNNLTYGNEVIEIQKSKYISVVHRESHFDIIKVQNYDSSQNLICEWHIYGLFTTKAYKDDVANIPLINNLAEQAMAKTNFLPNSYNYKEFISFVNSIPRDILFTMTSNELFEVAISYISSKKIGQNNVFIKHENHGAYDILICINSEPNTTIKSSLVSYCFSCFGNEPSYQQINSSDISSVIIRITVFSNKLFNQQDINQINEQIIDICKNWNNCFKSLNNSMSPDIFCDEYKAKINYVEASQDSVMIKKLLNNENLSVLSSINKIDGKKINITLFFKNKTFELSQIISILNNFGLVVEVSTAFLLQNIGLTKIKIIKISAMTKLEIENTQKLQENFNPLLNSVFEGDVENGLLNALSVLPSLNTRDMLIFRIVVKYMQQIRFPYNARIITEVISQNPAYIKNIVEYFYTKLDPNYKGERAGKLNEIENSIFNEIKKSSRENDERVFRVFFQIVQAIVRTNFFLNKEYISIKLHPKTIENLPKPVPFAEIFVYHSDFEAIHLRGGKVARGGLRWSDRIEDFRTEVLGLVKAQTVKNAVIVPVGSKGGFVIKADTSKMSRDEYFEYGKHCYKQFISACLDITDNIVNGKIVHPHNVIPTDGEDPYFVVAADKGTATFSDIANSVSLAYNFWLGDAFASGGSNGYDHKKMGITAKGAWIAVKRHFMEMAIDPEKQQITTVAIGDMSGDVFGNGLLRSKTIKLIAAFNHMHIFIDPNPDLEKSFKERERMFNLPRSTWADYSNLSEGGMVYARSETMLRLTPQIKELFNISLDQISPNELILIILKHKVDLLWNGGIGTYAKATNERNEDVGDKANDAIRVNGSELGAKVIGEGGNLGFTQLGRIEAAKSGVMLNTDAMDNSAGVDCSDHEVNIKIVLNALVATKKISLEERNVILADMTSEVDRLVLLDNYEQTQAISISYRSKTSSLERQAKFIKFLEKEGFLDRENEFLPSTDEIKKRKSENQHLTRPELCVLFGYSKMYLYQKLLASNLIDDAYFNKTLIEYFPTQMGQKFKNDLLTHKLKNEIIATSITNKIINRVGITFIHSISTQTSSSYIDVVRAFIIANDILDIDDIWKKIELLDFSTDWQTQLNFFAKIISAVESVILWILSNYNLEKSISEIITGIKENFLLCVSYIKSIKKENISSNEALSEISSQIEYFKYAQYALFASKVVSQSKAKIKIEDLLKTVFIVKNSLNLDIFNDMEISSKSTDIEKLAYKTAIKSITQDNVLLAFKAITDFKSFEELMAGNKNKFESFANFVNDIKLSGDKSISTLFLVADKIKDLI